MNRLNMLFSIKIFLLMLWLCSLSAMSFAQENTSYELNEHIVYYNVFNSTMIPADAAKAHNLVRAKDRVYVNIALVKKSGGNGIPANISGVRRNLMQQRVPLEFIEIKEATATYYLAPIRFNNEEILHIDITASNSDNTDTGSFTITKKLYRD